MLLETGAFPVQVIDSLCLDFLFANTRSGKRDDISEECRNKESDPRTGGFATKALADVSW